MKKLFIILALSCSTFCAAHHFGYCDSLILDGHLSYVQDRLTSYKDVIEYEDYGSMQHHLKAAKSIINKLTEDQADQIK